MHPFFNGCQRLARMNIRAARDPDRLESGMSEHIVVFVIDSNSEFAVHLVLLGPFNLVRLRAAHGHDLCMGHPIKQCVNVPFALCTH